ncbi:MAG: hypothetical protein DBX44_04640 [Oscillospiraceae bacterium]|nr:MAG: hypothetical protein DBX44_04640 [Oscillospiraceae bacterium]
MGKGEFCGLKKVPNRFEYRRNTFFAAAQVYPPSAPVSAWNPAGKDHMTACSFGLRAAKNRSGLRNMRMK